MEDKLSIRISIAEKYYPLKVKREEEERIRKAAKLINDQLLRYKQTYSGKEVSDFMAMVSLDFATKFLELEEKMDETPIIEKVTSLNEEITEYLDNVSIESS
jgi:cell division protein ZapA (FtsZ GTPase activity inhibitor)